MIAGYSEEIKCPFLGGVKCMGVPCVKWDELIKANPNQKGDRGSYGKCTAVVYKEDRRINTDLAKERYRIYKAGFTDGLKAFPIVKKGVKYVGNKGITLNDAIMNIEQIKTYNPRTGE